VVKRYCGITDLNYEAEFHEHIARTIPLLNKRAIDWRTVELIGNLSNRGERQQESIVARLTGTTKSSFMKPSQARFHCLLSGLRTRTGTFDGGLLR